jgi:hypothetical protein
LYLPRYLPDNVYFFLTIRRKSDQKKLLFETPTKIIDLKDYQLNSMEDMKAYIRLFFEDPDFKDNLNEWIGRQNITREDFVNKLVEKSKSEIGSPNFMYLRYILPQIATGYYQDLDNMDDLPDGLLAYYYDHWHKMNMTPVKINLVYILTVIRRPVSRNLLAKFASAGEIKVNQRMVQEVLKEWENFLVEKDVKGEKCYKVYHASFNDFLRSQEMVKAAGIEIEEIHGLIADALWEMAYGEDENEDQSNEDE